MTTKPQEKFNLETSLTELEQLIEKLESGQIDLEQSLQLFEKGVHLTKACKKSLAEAEKKVQQLTGDDISSELSDFPEGN